MSYPPLVRICALALSLAAFAPLFAADAETPVSPQANAGKGAHRTKVDINTADIPTLEAIPEIGTNFANAVVAARPFKSVDDLQRILRVGPEKMDTLRTRVMASPVKVVVQPPSKPQPSGVAKPSPVNDGKAVPRGEVTERYDQKTPKKSAEKTP
jgi:hypothetical protein